jgi:hypothetical protein
VIRAWHGPQGQGQRSHDNLEAGQLMDKGSWMDEGRNDGTKRSKPRRCLLLSSTNAQSAVLLLGAQEGSYCTVLCISLDDTLTVTHPQNC